MSSAPVKPLLEFSRVVDDDNAGTVRARFKVARSVFDRRGTVFSEIAVAENTQVPVFMNLSLHRIDVLLESKIWDALPPAQAAVNRGELTFAREALKAVKTMRRLDHEKKWANLPALT